MYICVCKGVTEKDLKEVVRTCGPALDQVQNQCGAATDCGSCLIKLQAYLAKQSPSQESQSAHSTTRTAAVGE